MARSRSTHVIELARDLLDDIELGRARGEGLILKASRLARWVGDDDVQSWLQFEMGGYNSTDPASLRYMTLTGRWTNYEKKQGYWGPLAQQEAAIAAFEAKLSVMRIPDSSSSYAGAIVANVINNMTATANAISSLSAVKSRVMAMLHQFVSRVYYEMEYEAASESIFENFKGVVDPLIAEHSGTLIEKIPSVMDRLRDGDAEAIAQALLTCRRIIDAFANAVYPPSDEIIEIDGNMISLDASKSQNRINAFIRQHTSSLSISKRLRQNLSNLYDRISTGVHSEVTANEAKALFLNTYLFCGEVLQLRETK